MIEIIKKWYPNIDLIRKDIGNTGYYIKYTDRKFSFYSEDPGEYQYKFISKDYIINHLTKYKNNEREKKLIALKIINEYENNFLL